MSVKAVSIHGRHLESDLTAVARKATVVYALSACESTVQLKVQLPGAVPVVPPPAPMCTAVPISPARDVPRSTQIRLRVTATADTGLTVVRLAAGPASRDSSRRGLWRKRPPSRHALRRPRKARPTSRVPSPESRDDHHIDAMRGSPSPLLRGAVAFFGCACGFRIRSVSRLNWSAISELSLNVSGTPEFRAVATVL